MAFDNAPVVGVAIEEEQTILLAQCDTGLVEEAIAETDVFALCLGSDFDHFEGLEGDVIRFGKGHHVGDQYGC